MKALTLSLILVSVCHLNAQWQKLNTNTNNEIYDISFVDEDRGWAVGYYGTVLRTQDGGNTWLPQSFFNNSDLYSVHFINKDTGFIAGYAGFYRSINGGVSWNTIPLSGTSSTFKHVEFIDSAIGFVTGNDNQIFKTTDRGNTWLQQTVNTPNSNNLPVSDISFPSLDTGYACLEAYNWGYLKTIDGGATWNEDTIGPITGWTNFAALHFTTVNRGFMAGWYIGAFSETIDGGVSWSTPSIGNFDLYDVSFNTTDGMAVGTNGTAIRTQDGGDTWNPVIIDSVNNYNLNTIEFTPAGALYIGGSNGSIYRLPTVVSVSKYDLSSLSVYPNPAHDQLYLNGLSNTHASVSIYDQLGKLILKTSYSTNRPIDVERLHNGVYHIVIQAGSSFKILKFIKS